MEKVSQKAIRFMCPEEGTQIIMQRHCNYDREEGFLIPESVENQNNLYEQFVEQMKDSLTPEEMKNTYFLFIASSTKGKNDLQRSKETTLIAKGVIDDAFASDQIINNQLKQGSRAVKDGILLHGHLVEPKMFSSQPEYLEFLKENTDGTMKGVFSAFEDDVFVEERQQMGAEGPDEIVERMDHTITALTRYSDNFHEQHPGCRLVIVSGTHYDTISPYTKSVYGLPKTEYVGVDYCGGFSITINKEKEANITINDDTMPLQVKESEHKPPQQTETPTF